MKEHAMAAKWQRVFVILLLLLGTLAAIGAVFLAGPRNATHSQAMGTAHRAVQDSSRP